MKLHAFLIKPNSIIRILWHLTAGLRLCRWNIFKLMKYVPDNVNSMTTAWNLSMSKFIKQPKTILDVGANNSQMIRLLQLFYGKKPKVYSFEPNIDLKPVGTVFNLALSNKDGKADFLKPGDSGWGRIADKSEVKNKKNNKSFIKVEMKKFETLIKNKTFNLKDLKGSVLLKIDTEGHEYKVLQGFGNYLKKIDYILLEQENRVEKDSCNEAMQIAQLLGKHGFKNSTILYSAHHGKKAPVYSDVLFWK